MQEPSASICVQPVMAHFLKNPGRDRLQSPLCYRVEQQAPVADVEETVYTSK